MSINTTPNQSIKPVVFNRNRSNRMHRTIDVRATDRNLPVLTDKWIVITYLRSMGFAQFPFAGLLSIFVIFLLYKYSLYKSFTAT